MEDLTCFKNGNVCSFCTRAEKAWKRFEENVDYVVPLSIRCVKVRDNTDILTDDWLPEYSAKDLCDNQLQDHDIACVIKWVEDKIKPTQAQLAISSPATRHYWSLRSQLKLFDSVLFYKWEDPITPRYLLVVPFSLRDEVLKLNHDVRDAAHMGQINTYNRVKQSFYWYRMRHDSNMFVKTCAKCNTNKKPQRQRRAELGEYHVGVPMGRVMIDMY